MTNNTQEDFDYMEFWEEDTMRNAEEFEEHAVETEHKDMRNKRRDEWREGKKAWKGERDQQRKMKRKEWD